MLMFAMMVLCLGLLVFHSSKFSVPGLELSVLCFELSVFGLHSTIRYFVVRNNVHCVLFFVSLMLSVRISAKSCLIVVSLMTDASLSRL